MFDEKQLEGILARLSESDEISWIEAKDSLGDLVEIGKAISALANAASYANEEYGYLIWGLEDGTWRRIGTAFSLGKKKYSNQNGDIWLHEQLGRRAHWDEFEVYSEGKRMYVLRIKNCGNRPVPFQKIPYIRKNSSVQELSKHPEIESAIYARSRPDWSARTCKDASLDDLDPGAIRTARENFEKKHPEISSEEIGSWDDATFLNKAKLTIHGEVTNAAILLLGKPESATLLSPAVAEISWNLEGQDGIKKDYEHFGPPFLLAAERVRAKIRNLKYRYIPDEKLFPEEVDMYDPWIIREALHNCVAHQDYSLNSRIIVTENENGTLLFRNAGSFLAGSIEKIISENHPQSFYRNRFLVETMVNLNMIDTIGSGIPKMFSIQRKKFFPMPLYDIRKDHVDVTVTGKVINLDYARILAKWKDLSILDVVFLDRVQRKMKIGKDAADRLRRYGIVEGRYPNLYVSGRVVEESYLRAQYIHNKKFDDDYYKEMILRYIREYPGSNRGNIDEFIVSKLPEILTKEQKKNKVSNLLSALSKKEKKIENRGTARYSRWFILLDK